MFIRDRALAHDMKTIERSLTAGGKRLRLRFGGAMLLGVLALAMMGFLTALPAAQAVSPVQTTWSGSSTSTSAGCTGEFPVGSGTIGYDTYLLDGYVPTIDGPMVLVLVGFLYVDERHLHYRQPNSRRDPCNLVTGQLRHVHGIRRERSHFVSSSLPDMVGSLGKLPTMWWCLVPLLLRWYVLQCQ